MSNTLTSGDLSIKIRKRVVNCYIWSTLLYGAETWTISKNMIDRIRAFEMWVWRKIQRISWQSHMKNDTVLKRIGEKRKKMHLFMSGKLTFFGYIIRRKNLHRVILEGRIPSRGRPRSMWICNIGGWVGRKHYGWLLRKAQDREKWRQIIAAYLQHVDGT